MIKLGETLYEQRARGRKLLVTYITGGLNKDWIDIIAAAVDGGADAIEVGIPFSDPMIDGPAIQQASQLAIEQGATPLGVLSALRTQEFTVPLAAMTYYNLVHHSGPERFAGWLAEGGVSGVILPDLSYEESGPWREAAQERGIETVQLVAPSTPLERAKMLCDASEGFVYAIGLMGITGERVALASSATEVGGRLKALTDTPVLVGIGVSNADQAVEVCKSADGVIIGSAIVRRVLEGGGPQVVYDFVRSVREALDAD